MHLAPPDDWLTLIAPLVETFGSEDPDTLAATSEHEVVYGLGGDDVITSAFNWTALLGGDGGDRLSTEFAILGSWDLLEDVHAVAVQGGGPDDDILNLSVGASGYEVQILVLADGGDGDDLIQITLGIRGETENANLVTLAGGGAGDDRIIVLADARGNNSFGDNIVRNIVDGGNGNDHITALAVTDIFSLDGWAINEVNGGEGNDIIEVDARVLTQGGRIAHNIVDGGAGDDAIRAFARNNSNQMESAGLHQLWGGDGNDNIEAIHSTIGGSAITELESYLDGGNGDDVLIATSFAQAWSSSSVLHDLDGGGGNDVLISRLNADFAEHTDIINKAHGGHGSDVIDVALVLQYSLSISSARSYAYGGGGDDSLSSSISATQIDEIFFGEDPPFFLNSLEGGEGSDSLEAHIDLTVFDMSYPDDPVEHFIGENRLDGGAGDDVLVASIAATTHSELTSAWGSNLLHGGEGDDQLTVIGGRESVLDGGTGDDMLAGGDGEDTLIGGEGDDLMSGGDADDTFVFHFDVAGSGIETTIWFRENDAGDGGDTPSAHANHRAWQNYHQQLEAWRWELEALHGPDLDDSATHAGITVAVKGGGPKKPDMSSVTWGAWDASFSHREGSGVEVKGEGHDTILDWSSGSNVLQLLGLSDDEGAANYWNAILSSHNTDANGDEILDTIITFDGGNITLLSVTTSIETLHAAGQVDFGV